MLKRTLVVLSLLILTHSVNAQIYNPVTWEFSYEKKSDRQYELIFTATIEAESHIYSMDIPEGGPIPTYIPAPIHQLLTQLMERHLRSPNRWK